MDSVPPVSEVEFEGRLNAVIMSAKRILLEKRRLRGTENIRRQGLDGITLRIGEDKLSRVRRHVETTKLREMLTARGASEAELDRFAPVSSSEELISLEDDLLDIANYAFIGVLLNRGFW